MAPFRASRSTRSGRPGGPSDADIFEGLPVRQWKLQESLLRPTDEIMSEAAKAAAAQNEKPELPMPKGSESYSAWSVALLRVARSGKVIKPNGSASHPGMQGKSETSAADKRVEETHRGTKRGAQNGFLATKWSQIPKNLEGPELEYLAKRRKGLQSSPLNGPGPWGAPLDTTQMRKTKVRRADEEGQPQVLEVMVPEGQTVEGEIKGDITLEIAAGPISTPAPGTVVQGLGVANEDGVVVATEGVMPLKRPRPARKKKKKKSKGTNKISSTGGLGVSASAEAFDEAQRRAQIAAESERVGDEGLQDDIVMTGTNGADEEEEEEGSDEDDEGEEEEGEGDNTTHGEGKPSDTHEASGEALEVAPKPEESAVIELEAELQKPEVENPQEENHGDISVITSEITQMPSDDQMDVQEETEQQEQSFVELEEDMEAEADDKMEVEMQKDVEEEAKEETKDEANEEANVKAREANEEVREETRGEAREETREDFREEAVEEAIGETREETRAEAQKDAGDEAQGEAREGAEDVEVEVEEEAREEAEQDAEEEAEQDAEEEADRVAEGVVVEEAEGEAREEAKGDVEQEMLEDVKGELSNRSPQHEMKDEKLQDLPSHNQPTVAEEDLVSEVSTEPPPEPVHEAPQLKETEDVKYESSHTPPRPSPEPLSPFTLSPISQAPESPSPAAALDETGAGTAEEEMAEELAVAQETPLSDLSRVPSTVQSLSAQSPLSPPAESTPRSNGHAGPQAADSVQWEESSDDELTRPAGPPRVKQAGPPAARAAEQAGAEHG